MNIQLPSHPNMKTRLFFLIVGFVVILLLAHTMTGNLIPSDNQQALIFQGGFLLVIFGSLLLEDKFTKPADAVINAIAVIISLVPVYTSSQDILWFVIVGYAVLILVVGLINLVLISDESVGDKRLIAQRVTYQITSYFGKSNLMFSAVFLYAVFTFYGLQSAQTAILIVFWGIYLSIWPLKIPHLLQALFTRSDSSYEIGAIVRVDDPDVIKVKLHKDAVWNVNTNLVANLGNGEKRRILPLYVQTQDKSVIGTGLLLDESDSIGFKINVGAVCRLDSTNRPLPSLVGVVTEGSKIARIYFETWKPDILSEGMLVYCEIKGEKVYYQITDGATTEEIFERHRYGFQTIEAHQLGTYHNANGFRKFTWLPRMNSPVYLVQDSVQGDALTLPNHQMSLGKVPFSDIEVVCDINDMLSHHTAILGVTGSGKTELAFRIIQQAINNGVKVFCVDITGQYIDKLGRFTPQELSIDEDLADELGTKLHDVETGAYGAGAEKKALKDFSDRLRTDIDGKVKGFLDGEDTIGIFTMPSISNTKATIQATEIYLSSIFKYGREITEDKQQILVVLEEAHTVIPEASTMGLGDYDSRGMVAKIAQIALQGRKYEVGLLVISQRTATVSKTVLTQCNTVITFASFDQTGIAFLSNIYGEEHTSKISNLPFLHALAFGKGIKSERPVVVELPFDESMNDSDV